MQEILEKAKLVTDTDKTINNLMHDLLPMLNEASTQGLFISGKFEVFGDSVVRVNNSNLIANIQHKGRQLIQLKDERKKAQIELSQLCSEKWNQLSEDLRNNSDKMFFYEYFLEKYYKSVHFGGLIPFLQELDDFLKS